MRFLRKNKSDNCLLVISDLHLGAGLYRKGRYNPLEDFHYDRELVDFLQYYASEQAPFKKKTLIINGDFLDFLAVPFVKIFDDEFWTEYAAERKFEKIIAAHAEVFEALKDFNQSHEIIYVIGNHDLEMVYPAVQAKFKELVGDCRFISPTTEFFNPIDGVAISHGHHFELAHCFDDQKDLYRDENNQLRMRPPWGSLYVTHIVNKYKWERTHINAVRPIGRFLVHGMIYDPVFTVRFMLGNAFYFIMARYELYWSKRRSLKELIDLIQQDLKLFRSEEVLMQEFFIKNPKTKVYIMGHTHNPFFRSDEAGRIMINTGTWTNMHYLDFGNSRESKRLTYAQLNFTYSEEGKVKGLESRLHVWRGTNKLPFYEAS
jgi:UDP-2,3-diacylglucosamine pyrophosphatase LpxH